MQSSANFGNEYRVIRDRKAPAKNWPLCENDISIRSFGVGGLDYRIGIAAFAERSLLIWNFAISKFPTAELCTIDAPYDFADDFYQIAFSPDDTKLAILSYNGAVHLLHIPRLRQGLRSIGLDWDSANPNLASRNEKVAEPLTIRVIAK